MSVLSSFKFLLNEEAGYAGKGTPRRAGVLEKTVRIERLQLVEGEGEGVAAGGGE